MVHSPGQFHYDIDAVKHGCCILLVYYQTVSHYRLKRVILSYCILKVYAAEFGACLDVGQCCRRVRDSNSPSVVHPETTKRGEEVRRSVYE